MIKKNISHDINSWKILTKLWVSGAKKKIKAAGVQLLFSTIIFSFSYSFYFPQQEHGSLRLMWTGHFQNRVAKDFSLFSVIVHNIKDNVL